MPKVIIALPILTFSFAFLLLICILFLTLTLILFSKRKKREHLFVRKRREIKRENRDGTGLLGGN